LGFTPKDAEIERPIFKKLGVFGSSSFFKRVPLGFGLKKKRLYGFKLKRYLAFLERNRNNKNVRILKAFKWIRRKTANVFQLYFGGANLLSG
jgi:hypothetical protein